MLDVGAAFRITAPGMVDEDAPHRLSRDRKEMGAVLPVHALVVDQAHVSLVDQRGGLQAVAGALAFHVAVREVAKLLVHDRRQLSERALIATAPRAEERADVFPNWITSAPALPHSADSEIIYAALPSPLPDSFFAAATPM